MGRTLVREEGRWLIRHSAKDYKTGRSYGERPPMVLAESMYPEVQPLHLAQSTPCLPQNTINAPAAQTGATWFHPRQTASQMGSTQQYTSRLTCPVVCSSRRGWTAGVLSWHPRIPSCSPEQMARR